MEKKKVYRIREKGKTEFVSLGYNRKNKWNVYPSAAINTSIRESEKDKYEVVVFEYELKEVSTIDLK